MFLLATLTISVAELISTYKNSSFQDELVQESVLLAIFLLVAFFLALRYCLTRLCVATLNEDSINLKTAFEKRTMSWGEIESLYKITFSIPRIFLLKVKGEKKVYSFFSTGNHYLLDGLTKNPRSMETLIERKITEHDIQNLD